MKRVIALTLVLFILSLGGLAAVTLWMCRAQNQVDFTNIVERGSASVAEGLRMTEYDLLSSRVLWTTEHELGQEQRETEAAFSGKQIPYTGYGREFSRYSLCPVAPGGAEVEHYLTQEIERTMEQQVQIHPADFAEYYDLCLSGWGMELVTALDVQEEIGTAEFPLLRIPTEAEDSLLLVGDVYGSGLRYYASVLINMVNRFTPMDVTVDGGTVVTAGFGPTVQAKQDWAPEGFGLWLVSGGTKSEELRIDLVYPLDIETQRVVKMVTTSDREKIFLFLAEDGELTLQVLRGDTFTLKQTVPMGKIGGQESEETYWSENDTQTVRRSEFEPVLVRRGEDFWAVAVGKQLTVLDCGENGVEVLFSCRMPDLYEIPTAEGMDYVWEDEEAAPEGYFNSVNPAEVNWSCSFESMSMDLKDGKLAMAWSEGVLADADVAVQIYSAQGLEYARFIRCGLYHRDVGAYLRSGQKPALAWAE